MQIEKQKLLISYILNDTNLFSQVNAIAKPAFFAPQTRKVLTYTKSFYETYKALPTLEQIKIETGEVYEQRSQLTPAESSYAAKEIEKFCREQAIKLAIIESHAHIESGEYGIIEKMIRDALTISLHKNLGLDYFADPEERLRSMLERNKPISTKWPEIDDFLAGGLNRREMIIFAAASGVGKSLTMANLAVNLLEQGLNGLYITLELSQDVSAKRFDSMITGIGQLELFMNIHETAAAITAKGQALGKFRIKRLPANSTDCNDIRAYLKELELVDQYVPDFICVDYMDLLTSITPINAENLFVKDKYIAEEMREISEDLDLIMITASQLNRSVHEMSFDEVSHAQISGGISKINTCDNMIAVLQTDMMKAAKEYMFKFLKTRSSDGVGNYVKMDWNPVSLRITNGNNQSLKTKGLHLKKIPKAEGFSTEETKPTTRSILDIMKEI